MSEATRSSSRYNNWMVALVVAACGGCCTVALTSCIVWTTKKRRERRGGRNDDYHLHSQEEKKKKKKKDITPNDVHDDERTPARRCRRLTLFDTMMMMPSTQQPQQQQEQRQQYPQEGSLMLQPIGIVRSVYALCVGTPRQGLLAPATRGRIELSTQAFSDATATVKGLEEFSHVWIQFVFHLNTQPKSSSSTHGNNNKTKKQITTIAPPALGGQRRVGVFATRSPHRPNPIGMTLARLDRITIENRIIPSLSSGKKKRTQVTCLYISGIDLVDGTPVLDIKPYVAVYDTVPPSPPSRPQPEQQQEQPSNGTCATSEHDVTNNYRVPEWVEQGLQTRRTVDFAPKAVTQLTEIIMHGNSHNKQPRLEFYNANELATVQEAIYQVLSVDVRSAWQTNKARQGAFQAERSHRIQQKQGEEKATTSRKSSISDKDGDTNNSTNHVCTQQLDNLLIHYTVVQASTTSRMESDGSGAEDKVQVTAIEYLPVLRK